LIFAIIAGAFILSLAIYTAIKIIGLGETESDAKIGKEIGILFNPLETGFETGKTTSFGLPAETRIYNKCNNNGNFGRHLIQISQKSFNKWTETNIDVGFSNKYIFSEIPAEGKTFYVFSKPFEFPFKVSDLIYLTSSKKKYCFIESPKEIKEELEDLQQENIFLENCSGIKICFNRENNCDVNVEYNLGYLEKNNKKLYFEGDALMYAAIFSDKELYECELKRLMQRVEQLTLLYRDKANFISNKDCNSNINSELIQLNNLANSLENSADLSNIKSLVEDVEYKNENAICRLW